MLPIITLAACCFLPAQEEAVEANNDFALKLMAALPDKGGNVFISPFSISSALAMTFAGAKGETAEEMAKTLCFPEKTEKIHASFQSVNRLLGEVEGCRLITANALWGQEGYAFEERFIDVVKKSYGAQIRELDYAGKAEEARETINDWVEEKTQGKIEDLIPPGMLRPLTRLVLTNAIYFKGQWALPFKEKHTGAAPFHCSKEKRKTVQMMSLREKFRYMEGKGFQAVELPYAGEALSMIVVLPSSMDSLVSLDFNKFMKVEVDLKLPRFKTEFQTDLSAVLGGMGMAKAFSAGEADLSGMNGRRDLFLSNVVHKAFVEVNEEGTEAAAATGAVVSLTAIRKPVVFHADRPFLFIIRHNDTGAILFLGRIVDP